LDGTLIDSSRDLIEATVHSLKRLGLEPPPDEVILGFVGGGARGLLQGSMGQAATAERLQDGLEIFLSYYGEHLLDNTQPYPGVREVLEHFSSKRLAVVTNKPEAFSRTILEGLDLARYFHPILGFESVERKKPHPEGLLRVLDEWGLEASEAVMVGDSPHDILAGRAAGMATVACAYGFKPLEEIAAAKPDHIIQDIGQLKDLIEA
jgi:phosphoglycolate phosphatase